MILIFGSGISGLGALELLENKGKKVVLIDDKLGPFNTEDGKKYIDSGIVEYIVKSPGISFNAELIKYALEKKIKIYSEIDIAYKYMNKNIKIVAFTGTNGKTTTVTKTYEILKKAGYKVDLGGNVGKSFAHIVNSNENLDYIVLELSSYQLENYPSIKANISGIINLTPDHLSRYKDVEDYYLTKFNIFSNQDINDSCIINLDDENFIRLLNKVDIKSNKIFISRKKKADIYVEDNNIYIGNDRLISIKELSLKGEHNLENMLFLIASAKLCNIDNNIIVEYLKEAKSIEHRMEDFFKKESTIFINDSKGTNVDSTIKAINSYDEDIFLICGGEDKKVPLIKLAEEISKKVKFVYIFGQNRFLIEKELNKIGYINYKLFETVLEVLEYIKENYNFSKNSYVVFSPATSSFDQFKNFEQRGLYFKEITKKILGGVDG